MMPQPHSISAPDWELVKSDVTCPLCDYNLRGLTEPRCPECGCRFKWQHLLDRRHEHPYLFEHHPRRNVWSFVQTALGGLRPWKFWASVRPEQTLRPGRLMIYWLMCVGLTGVMMLAARVAAGEERIAGRNLRSWSPHPLSYLSVNDVFESSKGVSPGLLQVWIWSFTWPLLTFGSLMVFWVSMQRFKVRMIHVVRCVLYSADWILWSAAVSVIVIWAVAARALLHGGLFFEDDTVLTALLWATAAMYVFPPIKLWAAYRKYLRFSQAWAIILASQIIVILAAAAMQEVLAHVVR